MAKAYALSGTNLISFETSSPSIGKTLTITGVNGGETLVGIDFRVQNGMLYGLGVNATANTATLYAISVKTGVAGIVGSSAGTIGFVDGPGNPVDLPDPATAGYGFDFNPAADRIRVTTSTGLNFRINPNTGLGVDGDFGGATGSVTGLNPDGPINGGTTAISGAAYTNNQPNTSITTLYTLDAATDSLFIQNPANGGTETLGQAVTLGGNPLNFTAASGFDIAAGVNAPASNTAVSSGFGLSLLTVGGVTGLYSINLVNAQATFIGNLLNGATAISGLALENNLGGAPAIALASNGNLVRFNTATPGTTTTVAVAGVSAGEVLVGIDYRPQTGQLYGLGINALNDRVQLYLIDPQTGAVQAVGSANGFVTAGGGAVDLPDPASAGYGFDFNPTVDRIRVTTSTGLNFRINPITGAPVDGDNGGAAGSVTGVNTDGQISGLPPGSTGVSSTAYTNNYGQSLTGGVTTLYTLDAASDSLFIQNPANAGTETSQVIVKLGGSTLDFTAVSGFDISSDVLATSSGGKAAGVGLATLTVGGLTGLYEINLASGAAKALGAIGGGVTSISGFTVGQTPALAPVKSDFNHDGRADILWRNDNGTVASWQLNGTAITSGGNIGAPGQDWQIKGNGDVNGDSRSDIIWRHSDGTVAVWMLDGSQLVVGGNIGQPSNNFRLVGTGDFNGDGKSDILWRNIDGTVSTWLLDGTQIVSGGNIGQPGLNWHVAGTGDFNGDGKSDILWRNDNGTVAAWLMNGTQILSGANIGQPGNDWKVADTGDFNGDGKSDIVWRNDNGTVGIWFLNGASLAGGGNAGQPGSEWHLDAAADVNGDLRDDLIWRKNDGTVATWLMNGTTITSGGNIGQPGNDWHVQNHHYDFL